MKAQNRFLALAFGWMTFLALVGILSCQHQNTPTNQQAKIVLQSHAADCGPAALATVARFYNLNIQPDEIAKRAGTTEAGTTLSGLAQAADEIGFEATGMELSLAELKNTPLPLIAHVNGNHFIVVQSFHDGLITLLDPAVGRREIDASTFQRMWKGYVLLIPPKK